MQGFTTKSNISGNVIYKKNLDGTWTPAIPPVKDNIHEFSINNLQVVVKASNESKPGKCDGHAFVLVIGNNGKPPYTYNWASGDWLTISGNASVSELCVGEYAVEVIGYVGCSGKVFFSLKEPKDDDDSILIKTSFDPNDIIGPAGFGPRKWVSKNDVLPYTIRFENSPEFATAPAQVVKITQPLSKNTDITSFRLSDFGFGSFIFQVPSNSTYYSNRLNVVDSLGVLVDVVAAVDFSKKEAFWIFKSIDPTTGLSPTNPELGFLVVNDTITHSGEGFVSYIIKPSLTSVTGDTIEAVANIVFDINEPILTPEILNTVDALPPTSIMDSVQTIDATTYRVSWSATDDAGGCGVKDFLLYYSKNDSPFVLYNAPPITSNSAIFTGAAGQKYSFVVLARDNVNNTEKKDFITDSSALPITLISFTAVAEGNRSRIEWSTASELNNDRFEVERSSDGRNFSLLATVKGKGTSNTIQKYKVYDNSPLNGINYYRLIQYDLDGKATSHGIRIVEFSLPQVITIIAFPNPTTGDINLKVNNYKGKELNVAITDMYGRVVHKETIQTSGNGSTYKLNLRNSLIPGLYTIQVIGENLRTSLKVVVM